MSRIESKKTGSINLLLQKSFYGAHPKRQTTGIIPADKKMTQLGAPLSKIKQEACKLSWPKLISKLIVPKGAHPFAQGWKHEM